ncbi:DUF2975 domain-containing protein [Sphingoaurantiacus capsulatus]|uniref:DUF2975 domain-containing protein n=1 Tax=Sphingoaurantiacus capsulatus TaxID=1771310 RepID=A0ABV7X8D6_9SPHN
MQVGRIKAGCTGAMVALPLLMIAYWTGMSAAAISTAWLPWVDPVPVDTTKRILGALACAIPIGIAVVALLQLRRLADAVGRGDGFGIGAVRATSGIAASLAALGVALVVTWMLVPLALTFDAGPGNRHIVIGIDAGTLLALAGAAFAAIMARLLAAARQMAEEQAFTV